MPRKFIRSVFFADCYLTLDGRDVSGWRQGGSGAVYCMNQGANWEYLDVQDVGNGQHAIASTAFKSAYLRMYAKDVRTDGGEVNLQNAIGDLERFYIRDRGRGRIAIESVAYPGCFLRMHGIDKPNHRGFGWVNAAKGVQAWEEFEMIDPPPPLSAGDVRAIVGRYGPELKLHKDERYQMCSIEWFLDHGTLKSDRGVSIRHPKVSDLPTDRNNGTYWIEFEDGAIGGMQDTARAYVRALHRNDTTYSDFQFWFFYAYNGPATVNFTIKTPFKDIGEDLLVKPLGEHYGDWECCMLRVDNASKNVVGAWLSQHSGGQTLNKFEVDRLRKRGAAPVVFSSHNGHAVFPSVGANVTDGFDKSGIGFGVAGGLVNNCNDQGPSLDCSQRNEIVSVSWLGAEFPEPNWVKYPFRWGPNDKRPYDISPVVDQIKRFVPNIPGRDTIVKIFVDFTLSLLSKIGDDRDGPEGPREKGTWKGEY